MEQRDMEDEQAILKATVDKLSAENVQMQNELATLRESLCKKISIVNDKLEEAQGIHDRAADVLEDPENDQAKKQKDDKEELKGDAVNRWTLRLLIKLAALKESREHELRALKQHFKEQKMRDDQKLRMVMKQARGSGNQ